MLALFAGAVALSRWWTQRTPPPALGPKAATAKSATAPAARERPAQPRTPPKEPAAPRSPATAASSAGAPLPAAAKPAPLKPGEARVALVIDDLGRSLADLETLAALRIPLSYAVLPFETMTAQVAAALAERRVEILAHLPMASEEGKDPGAGALLAGMSPRELARRARAAIAAVPGATGANNHMGSALTADRAAMSAILRTVGERNLFFLDSRTSAESVGFTTARELGLPAAQRDVFLDSDPSPTAIAAEFQRLLDLARERGTAIAIGHPHPATLEMLAREVPLAVAAGYEFVPVSYLLERAGELPE